MFNAKKHSLACDRMNQSGLGVVEVLVTLTLLSLTVIILTNFQLRLLKNTRYNQIYHVVLNGQVSLFEELRSCASNSAAKNNVVEKWQAILDQSVPHAKVEISRNAFGYQSVIIGFKNQKKIILNGCL